MDYRLDLYSAITEYEKQMTNEDALFVICYNQKQGDLLVGISGNELLISAALANDDNLVTLKTDQEKIKHDLTKRAVLNIAINILRTDKELREKFKQAIQSL